MDGRDEWPRIIRLVCSGLMKFGKSSDTRRSKNIDIAICIRVRDLIELEYQGEYQGCPKFFDSFARMLMSEGVELADIKRRFICVTSMSNKDGDF